MTIKPESDIVTDVRICMDEENTNASDLLNGTDSKEMNNLIKSKLPEAYRAVNMAAAEHLLEPTVEEKNITATGGVPSVEIPRQSALRLLSVRVDGWSRGVSDFVKESDRAYAELHNPITTGQPYNPKVAIVDKDASNYRLELYGVKDAVSTVRITSVGDYPTTGSVSIATKVYRAMVYYAAGLTYQAYKDAHGDVLMNQAMQMIK